MTPYDKLRIRNIKFEGVIYDKRFLYCTFADLMDGRVDAYKSITEIQLSTGFIDKNDREIFEGDILKAKHTHSSYLDDNHCRIVWRYNRTGKVELFCVADPDEIDKGYHCKASGIGLSKRNARRFEIIGNYFENPDLINTLSQ